MCQVKNYHPFSQATRHRWLRRSPFLEAFKLLEYESLASSQSYEDSRSRVFKDGILLVSYLEILT